MGRFDIDLGDVSSERIILDKGSSVEGIITKGECVTGTSDKGDWARLEFNIQITDVDTIKKLEQDTPKMRYQIMLGVDQETKSLNGQNDRLGKFMDEFNLREKQEDFQEGLEDIEDPFEAFKLFFNSLANSLVGQDVIGITGINEYEGNKSNTLTKISSVG